MLQQSIFSQTVTKSESHSMSRPICVDCSKKISADEEIKCDYCHKSYHTLCSKLSRAEAACLKAADRSVLYNCSFCKNQPNLIKVVNELKELVTALQQEVKELKSKKSTNPDSTILQQNEIINEIYERERRANNIVLYNIEDKELENPEDKLAKDKEKVINIIKSLAPDISLENIKIHRLGKIVTKNKPRPVKVCMNSRDDAFVVVKNRRKLRERREKVFVSFDETDMQRKIFKEVHNEFKNRRDNDGEKDIFIKYIKGLPTIIKKSS